jgi:hypothetical protein
MSGTYRHFSSKGSNGQAQMNPPLLPVTRALAASIMLGLAACSTTPRPPPEFHVAVTYSPAAHATQPSRTPIAVGRFEDARDLPDRSRIGELHAPGYNPVPVAGTSEANAIGAGLQLLFLTNPRPTGWWVYVKGTEGLAPPIERALGEALNRAGYAPATEAPLRLTGAIRTFWLRPSWTTRCDAEIALSLIDDNGSVVWTKVVAAQAEKFVGLFGDEAFENVVRMTIDALIGRATTEFSSPEFAAAVTRTSPDK